MFTSQKLHLRRIWLSISLIVVMGAVAWGSLFSCQSSSANDGLHIHLRWSKAYPDEDWSKVRTGLIWSLSYLGAALPTGSFDAAATRQDSSHFELKLDEVGFSPKALKALHPIVEELKQSEEYQKQGSIDLGRFLMLTVYSSWNYYTITDVPRSLQEFKTLHNWGEGVVEHLAVTSSFVAKHHRVVQFHPNKHWQQFAFIAAEGNGSLEDSSFTQQEYETLDLMPNGQIRVGVYDADGQLKANGSPELSFAGKPGKCLWCHEMYLQPLFTENPIKPGYMNPEDFQDYITAGNHQLDSVRAQLHTDITYGNRQDHTYSELLYISFMESSANRLAQEWKMDSSQVQSRVAPFPSHIYEEFPFLGSLYPRDTTDILAPYHSVRVPSSAREFSSYEPKIKTKAK